MNTSGLTKVLSAELKIVHYTDEASIGLNSTLAVLPYSALNTQYRLR